MLTHVLNAFSHPPRANGESPGDVELCISQLLAVLPELRDMPPSKILDYGCGTGEHAVGLARMGHDVTGLDINERFLAQARATAEAHGVAPTFTTHQPREQFDVVLSYNSMEHVSDPDLALAQMRSAVRPGGTLMIAFGLPWLSAYGAHMHHITPIPWVHLIFPERTILRVRNQWYDDGASRFEEIEGGLNRMTLGKFRRCAERAGLRPEVRLTAMKQLPMVTRIPVLREFLTTRLTAIATVGHVAAPEMSSM